MRVNAALRSEFHWSQSVINIVDMEILFEHNFSSFFTDLNSLFEY